MSNIIDISKAHKNIWSIRWDTLCLSETVHIGREASLLKHQMAWKMSLSQQDTSIS